MPSQFNEAAWVARFGAVLEAVAADAKPSYSPDPPDARQADSNEDYWAAVRRRYRALAARAKRDPDAASQFNQSHLWIDTDLTEATNIFREHPLMRPGLVRSGKDEAVAGWMLNRGHGGTLKWLVKCLAKLSVKEGGEEAARRWHRYLTAGADYSIPAWEITVFHGLVVRERFDLGADVYLAPYEHAMNKFDLPEEPEPFPKESYPDAAVLVRSLMYGPGVAPPDDPVGLPHARITFSFPTDYSVDLEGWFDDSKLIVDLLSIAARVPLLSRTRYVRLAKWIAEMDPNFAFGTQTSGGYLSDLWPKGRDISKDDVDAFVELSRSSYTYPGEPGAMNLAIRRLAASFSRSGGRFGLEDRILDVAIALEVLYGGKTGRKLAPRAAGLLGAGTAEQKQIYEGAKRFYTVRSSIVHWKKPTLKHDVLEAELKAGSDLACRTLASLVKRNDPVRWADVLGSLKPETRAHINAQRHQKCK